MRLKEFRINNGYSQKTIADYLSCSVTVYSRYETETREPSLDVLIKLADFYKTTIDELVGRTPIPVVIKNETLPSHPADGMKRVQLKMDLNKESIPSNWEERISELIRIELQKKGL